VHSDRVTSQQRKIVIARAKQCCEYCYCQADFSPQSFSVEHITPRNRDGQTVLENLALSCQGCNNFKHIKSEGIDPVTKQVVPLYHPRQQAWYDHFAWDEDYTLILGLTPTGRATVQTLKLNRPSVINLRRVLFAMSEHPPLDSLPPHEVE
jgi:HNH endonuclease